MGTLVRAHASPPLRRCPSQAATYFRLAPISSDFRAVPFCGVLPNKLMMGMVGPRLFHNYGARLKSARTRCPCVQVLAAGVIIFLLRSYMAVDWLWGHGHDM